MQLQGIQTKIYELRGQKVMFDFDIAELYEVETRTLNQAVKGMLIFFLLILCFRLRQRNGKICHHNL